MSKLKTKTEIRTLILLCMGVYFFSYLTRINFTAIIVELVYSEGITKRAASVVTTVAFITYGAGQLVSGYMGDRFDPRRLIFGGYIVTVSMNFLMPFLSANIPVMAIVWGINGIAQAFMWPPLVKIMTSALSDEVYSKAVPLVGMGSAGATIAVYLLSPVIIEFLNWKYVFFIFGSGALIAAFVWLAATKKLLKDVRIDCLQNKPAEAAGNESPEFVHILTRILPIIILTIAIQGVLRDGISTWVPSLFSETFRIKSSISILTGVALPVFHVICNLVSYQILKIFKNQVFKAITVYFALTVGLLLFLFLFGLNYMWLALLTISAVSGLVCGINLFQTAYIPKYFKSTGSVSTICGLMNFSTYIGSALSTYLFAVISDAYGWNMTVVSWLLFATAGMLITLYIHFRFKSFQRKLS